MSIEKRPAVWHLRAGDATDILPGASLWAF
jgi:hypothetical protein